MIIPQKLDKCNVNKIAVNCPPVQSEYFGDLHQNMSDSFFKAKIIQKF